jgi:hypothetical protein
VISKPVKVRPVDAEGHVLPMSLCMRLAFDPGDSYAVRLVDPSGVEVVFARTLFEGVLQAGRMGDGAVRLHMTFQQAAWVVISRPWGHPFAVRADSVAAFLALTYEVVPPGTEDVTNELDRALITITGGTP